MFFHGQVDRYRLPLTNTSTPEATYNVCGGFLVAFGLPVKNNGPFSRLHAMKLGLNGRLYIADNGAGPAFVFNVLLPGRPYLGNSIPPTEPR